MKGILKEELIGLETEVIDAKNKSLIGIKGRIVNETKFTLHIRTAKGIKRVLKEQGIKGISEDDRESQGRRMAVAIAGIELSNPSGSNGIPKPLYM